MLRLAILSCALAGCAYQPGSFEHGLGPGATFEGERVTVGCLDVAISRRPDYDGSAVLQYRFGNRCNRPIEVDLQRVAVVGRFGDREVELSPYDPGDELRPARLPGRHGGREAIAYSTRGPAIQVCVDAASIVRAQPARWLCFGQPAEVGAKNPEAAPPEPPAEPEPSAEPEPLAEPEPPAGAPTDAESTTTTPEWP